MRSSASPVSLASRDGFLQLRLASLDWRIFALSGSSVAPLGWMAIGLALILTGAGVLTARRTPAVLSELLVISTAGYFAVSLSVVPYLYGRHYRGSRLDPQAVATAIVLVLVALLVIAALSRLPATGLTAVRDVSGEDRARRRWVRAAIWSALGTAAVAGISVWAWLTWGPRLVGAEVFPDAELASCVVHEMGMPASSATVSGRALSRVLVLPCNGHRVKDLRGLDTLTNLASLGLANNSISDLTPLANLEKLGSIKLGQNQVSDLRPLAGLPVLTNLGLSGNSIGSPAPLRDLPALSMLNISRNRISDATTFAGFAALEELWVGGNLLTDVTPLADLASLTGADLEGADLGTTAGVDALKARNIYVGGLA